MYHLFTVEARTKDPRKWLYLFEGVDIIIFLCPLDLTSPDTLRNSLILFENMCKSEWFVETPVMLLFTKFDLFMEQLGSFNLSDVFNDFTKDTTFKESVPFITSKFLNIRKRDQIWTHFCRFDDDIESLVNNIGGSMKDIMYNKRQKTAEQATVTITATTTPVDDRVNTKERFFKGLKKMIQLKK
jgi:hypothetical protein